MEKELDYFGSYEWMGKFSTPDNVLEFPGKLTHTPEQGARLEFFCSMDTKVERTEI